MMCDVHNCPNQATRGVSFYPSFGGRILTHRCRWHAEELKRQRRRQGAVMLRLAEPFDEYWEEQ